MPCSLLWLEINLGFNVVLWIVTALDRKRLLGVESSVQYQLAHFQLGHSDPVWLGRRFVRVEQLNPEHGVGRHGFVGLALLVELC